MSLPEGFIEELRKSVSLSKIILNKVKLEKRGRNSRRFITFFRPTIAPTKVLATITFDGP